MTAAALSRQLPATETGANPGKRNILLVFAGLMVTMLLALPDQTIFSTVLCRA